MACFPSRRVLFLPSWLWVVLPVPLLWFCNHLDTLWLPGPLTEPPEREQVLSGWLLVQQDGDSYRFIPHGQRDSGGPVWDVTVTITHETSTVWSRWYFVPHLLHLTGRWTYGLAAYRADKARENDKSQPYILPAEAMQGLRPLVLQELNSRDPDARKGDRLERLLMEGLSASSYRCPQNGVVVLGWLSLPLALVALCAMFVKPHCEAARPGSR